MPPISGTMITKQAHPDGRALSRLHPQSGQKACSLLPKRASRWLMRKREMKREKQTQVGKHTQEHDSDRAPQRFPAKTQEIPREVDAIVSLLVLTSILNESQN